MRHTVPAIVMATILAVVLVAIGPPVDARQKRDDALVVRGELYRVIWACNAANVFAGRPEPSAAFKGCYGEWLRVEAVRADGWADVIECTGVEQRAVKCDTANRWRVNLTQAQAVKPYGNARAAD
jgi:hypothetical protein